MSRNRNRWKPKLRLIVYDRFDTNVHDKMEVSRGETKYRITWITTKRIADPKYGATTQPFIRTPTLSEVSKAQCFQPAGIHSVLHTHNNDKYPHSYYGALCGIATMRHLAEWPTTFIRHKLFERGSSAEKFRTRNRESLGSNHLFCV